MELLYVITFTKNNTTELFLHWGINVANLAQWKSPDHFQCTVNTEMVPFNKMACQNLFSENSDIKIELKINLKNNITGLSFVFHDPINVREFFFYFYYKNKWFNNNNRDFTIEFSNLKNIIKRKKRLANNDSDDSI